MIKDDGAIVLGISLAHNTSLTNLQMNGCGIGDRGCIAIGTR